MLFCSQGLSGSYPARGRHPPADTPEADTFLGRHNPPSHIPSRQTPPGRHPPPSDPLPWSDEAPPLVRHPLGRHPPGRHPLGRHPLGRHHGPPLTFNQTATVANGTRPTGMHSCFELAYSWKISLDRQRKKVNCLVTSKTSGILDVNCIKQHKIWRAKKIPMY